MASYLLESKGAKTVRWLVFILLAMGGLIALSVMSPSAAGNAGLFRPFTDDSKPIVGLLPGPNSLLPKLFGGAGCLCFGLAVIGLFHDAIPTKRWPALVVVAVALSLPLYIAYLGPWMITPILVSVVLLWGVLIRKWSPEALRLQMPDISTVRVHPLMHIPVPWIFVLAFLAGVGLEQVLPITIASPSLLQILRIAGVLLFGAGCLVAFSGLAIFHASRTTTVPFQAPSRLVTWGPYRLTRNPMYVGLTVAYVGIAGIKAQVWPLLLVPLILIYLQRIVIPVEEKRLNETFEGAYSRYCSTVRRWI